MSCPNVSRAWMYGASKANLVGLGRTEGRDTIMHPRATVDSIFLVGTNMHNLATLIEKPRLTRWTENNKGGGEKRMIKGWGKASITI